MSRFSFVALLAFACLVPSAASAQRASGDARLGFFGGFALHAGEIACEGDVCDGLWKAGGLSGNLGWGFSPKLKGVFDVWYMGHTEDDVTLHHTIATFNARYHVVPAFWIQGGLGVASAGWRYDGVINLEDRTENVAAIAFGAGLELVRRRSFALDLNLRVGVGLYDDNDNSIDDGQTGRSSALGLGFTWF
ncbi:MAG: hypothetical protein SFX73_32175 [Kofleriaceae bacterium]|nr:hypothetical protein [Kofleriaceae bacterium]